MMNRSDLAESVWKDFSRLSAYQYNFNESGDHIWDGWIPNFLNLQPAECPRVMVTVLR